ncbi:MAG: diguanylate cyclase [Roseibium sp.]
MPRQHISRLAFMLAGLLIAVTSASLIFVGFVASHASDQQAIENEKRLFQSALQERFHAIVHEQISVTSSDKSVSKLVRDFDPGFARQSFHMLWNKFSLSKVMLISDQNEVLAESFEEYTHITRHSADEVPELSTIISKLQDLYHDNRVRVPGGFGHRSLQGLDPSQYATMGFVHLDGKPALFSAMPIMPDAYEVTLPDGDPTILISAHYIDDALLKRLNSQLSFSSLTFKAETSLPQSGSNHVVLGQDDTPIGYFQWDSQTVGTSIWPTVIPVIAVLSVLLAALAFGIAWRIGQLTSSLQASEQQNRHLALHDSLSGLANRLQFNRVLVNAAKDLPLKPFAVLHCDLDKFKAVNDTYGHAAGDWVIKTMAARLTEVVGGPGLVCRVGGDEFMIIYRASTERPEVENLCQALIDEASKPIEVAQGKLAHVGLSIGVALAPDDGIDPDELVVHSDTALYQAKEAGRGRFAFYSDLPNDSFVSENILDNVLRKAEASSR